MLPAAQRYGMGVLTFGPLSRAGSPAGPTRRLGIERREAAPGCST